MPSSKKRINLTVPDEIYTRIVSYEKEHGLYNDATACLQLIVQQLNSIDNGKLISSMFRNTNPDILKALSNEGLDFAVAELKKNKG